MHIKMSYKNSLMPAYIRLDLTCVGGFEMHKKLLCNISFTCNEANIYEMLVIVETTFVLTYV